MKAKRQKANFVDRLVVSYAKSRAQGLGFFSAVFSSTWSSLGGSLNAYDATDVRNQAMRGVIGRQASAADLVGAQPYLRNLCRNYERNNATVRAIVEGLVANVVGSGIALEPDTGDAKTDEKIRAVWSDYIRDCFIDGLNLYAGQQMGFRDVVVAGEAIWRLVVDEERSKKGKIALCVLPLESEWLGPMANYVATGSDSTYVGGIKLDRYCRPQSYKITDPSGREDEVPARFIIHAFERRRSLQIRGEPWLAPIITTLRQEKDLVMAELEAAKNTSGFAAAITSSGGVAWDTDEKGSPVRDINIGSVVELMPGEGIELLSHNRPSQAIKPFREMLRGDMAGSMRLGERFFSRDVSKANYSSMRADMLDNERLLGPVRDWYGHATVGKLYQAVLPYLAAKAGIPVPKSDRYRLLPDGQPYVDPEKDARAALIAIKGGLSTYEAEIAKRGGDYKAVWKKLADEQAELQKLNLQLSVLDGEMLSGDGLGTNEPPAPPADAVPDSGKQNPGDRNVDDLVKRAMDLASKPSVTLVQARTSMDAETAELMGKVIADAMPKQEAPVVNFMPPPVQVEVTTPAPTVNVAAPNVTVEAPNVTVAAPTVNVAAPHVTVDNEVTVPQRTVRAMPQRDGTTIISPVD